MDSSVHHSDSLSVNSSPSAANLSKLPDNCGEKTTVNYLHENPVKSPTVSTLYVMPFGAPVGALSINPVHTSCDMSVIALSMHHPYNPSIHWSVIAPVHASAVQPIHPSCTMSVFAPVHALPVLSILPYDDEPLEFLDGFSGTSYGEKKPFEIIVKFPHDVTLTLQQAKFPEETPDTTKRVIYPGNFMLTRIRVKLTVINLRNYMLGVFHMASCTMRCVHGSINKILLEWDPGPTYDVQRL